MALEQWLYEQIDKGITVEPWIARIVAESESLAFAGLLLDVGKRAPELFFTVLAPLFFTWEIWNWDFQLATLRQSERQPPGYWGQQAPRLFKLAQDWHQLPHRSEALLWPNGTIAHAMLGHRQFRAFFEEYAAWRGALQQDEEPEHLRLLIERLDPDNYTFEQRGAMKLSRWTSTGRRRSRERMRRTSASSPSARRSASCRGAAESFSTLARLFRRTNYSGSGISSKPSTRRPPELPSNSSGPLFRLEDVLCAGIALLLSTSRDWLLQDASRMAWCRHKLQATIDNPPAPRRFDSELSIGNERWDCLRGRVRHPAAHSRSQRPPREEVSWRRAARLQLQHDRAHHSSGRDGSQSVGQRVSADGGVCHPMGGAASTPSPAR